MKIIWSLLAHASFMDIRDSIFDRFGYQAEQDYVIAVDKVVRRVAEFPNSGKQEFELAEDGSVRSVPVRKLSKIIYYVEDDTLYIADVCATRQDPDYLKERSEK